MAGDLVMDPRIPQTVEHDLESVFWILLWNCLLFMKSGLEIGVRSSIIKGTMNPRVFLGSGGVNKSAFMTSWISLNLNMPENRPMQAMLRDLHALLGERYLRSIPVSNLQSSTSTAPGRTQSETEHTIEGATMDATQSDDVLIKHIKHKDVLVVLDKYLTSALYSTLPWRASCLPVWLEEIKVCGRTE